MALRKSALSQIPERNKDLIFGFIRESQNNAKLNIVIPVMINYLCLVYFNQNKDCFNAELTHHILEVNKNTIICKHSFHSKCCAYLRNIVSKNVHIWKFRINNPNEVRSIVCDEIGVTKAINPSTTNWNGYALRLAGIIINGSTMKFCRSDCKKDGDLLEMMLDFNTLSLSFKINNNNFLKALDIEPGSYRAGIRFNPGFESYGYTLISYQEIY